MDDDALKLIKVARGQHVTEAKRQRSREMRRSMTQAEAVLWEQLREGKLGARFRRQQVVEGFIADFYCPKASLVVEADGAAHEANYDRERDIIFAAKGIKVMRFQNEQILGQMKTVLGQIAEHLNR